MRKSIMALIKLVCIKIQYQNIRNPRVLVRRRDRKTQIWESGTFHMVGDVPVIIRFMLVTISLMSWSFDFQRYALSLLKHRCKVSSRPLRPSFSTATLSPHSPPPKTDHPFEEGQHCFSSRNAIGLVLKPLSHPSLGEQ